MNIALGPNMLGHPAPEDSPRNLAELGYKRITLSPRHCSGRSKRRTMQKSVGNYWTKPKL